MVAQAALSPFDQFLLDIVQEKHGAPLAEDLKQQMIDELKPKLTQWITLKAMTAIAQSSPADLKTLQTMIEEQKSPEEIQTFIQSKIPDITPFLTKTLLSFRQTYIGTA